VKVHCTFRQQQRRILFATRLACTLQVLRSKVLHFLSGLYSCFHPLSHRATTPAGCNLLFAAGVRLPDNVRR
jgi:hypothetical protein